MRHVKSERLKKLETELNDLEQWLKLGLVPKKDVQKHKEEIQTVRAKIREEKDRLEFLKESGDIEEYVTPKRNPTKTAYTDMATSPDIDAAETGLGTQATGVDLENEGSEFESSVIEEKDDNDDQTTVADQEEESYFSDRNRWRRGGIIDPDADEW